ncbi:hypothetical protein A3C32_03595 [Candidatus Daviesbacteria bacterium RIFCSPHIGHO2_02_FULL_41_14]|uniref:Rhamnosyl O-methyltransferase n=1 Tax=Candidatus Daviesbacteria bacterium RIFCSPLOWO2_01_FULL_40_24 TaxID=1797787 RepID=A0A1F5MJN2_9BACT|nr:MAG: hypothetical protein A2780_01285 [Candidatus Daviesbacteria bacterium RIFCSPHIGHO2_01_FULL_41_45]OGE35505.1 MAG: hypothetical protein A3C32_03595 [Candidatus Daviesbacteria bacterium RIFCSPHIGHO2_02_FULL_41_14]OGE65596.1 MAG: hypothetical protein A3B49_02170 [Candidatus Daviesbacteria bacterium RIFCSPLOWO2_01_FULL_40_24]
MRRKKFLNSPNHPAPPPYWHMEFVTYIAWLLQPNVYVELGIESCLTFNQIIPYAKHLIGVDNNPEAGKNMQPSTKTQFIPLSTNEYIKTLKKHPIAIDLLFIDADHDAKSVLQDFKNFFPFVTDQGIILLHDSYPSSWEATIPRSSSTCYQAIQKLAQKQHGFEMITIPLSPGITICRKFSCHLPWLS